MFFEPGSNYVHILSVKEIEPDATASEKTSFSRLVDESTCAQDVRTVQESCWKFQLRWS